MSSRVNLSIDGEFVGVVTKEQAQELQFIAQAANREDLVRKAEQCAIHTYVYDHWDDTSIDTTSDDPPPPGCAVATLAIIGGGLTVLAEVGYRLIQWVN